MSNDPAKRARNRLLCRLQPQDYAQLLPHLKTLFLESGQVLYEAGSEIEYIYFPINCVLSAVRMMADGSGIEVGTIGNEGVAGLTAFQRPTVSPHRMLVQVAGSASRIESRIVEREVRENPALASLLLRHYDAFFSQVSQSVACNGLHPLLKRCCRWLLMTHDRVGTDHIFLTHEFLSYMLGVRRQGVTETLQTLQDQGLISTGRGAITITNRAGLEAASCECYGVVVGEYDRLLGAA